MLLALWTYPPRLILRRVLFPGALNSEFTNTLSFLRPSKSTDAIPTYRCLNQYGEIIDKSVGADTAYEEALGLYKNMVTCMLLFWSSRYFLDKRLITSSEHNGPPNVRSPAPGPP